MDIKILIIRLSAVGDVVHTLPALHAIRNKYPEARVDWLVEQGASTLLQDHPLIDNLYIFRKQWRRNFLRYFFKNTVPFFKKLRKTKYDWAIDFQGLTKSGLGAYFSGASRIIGFGDKDGRELNKLFTNVKIKPPPALHVIERNLCLLQPLGIRNPEIQFPFPEFHFDDFSLQNQSFVAINPGAGWVTKRIPLDILAKTSALIFQEKKLKTIITWGPGESNLAKALCEKITSLGGDADIAPQTTLPQLASLISRAALFIGGDTGPSHIAAALQVPVLAVFGASDSKRNRPYGKHCVTLQKFEIPCVPCWKTHCQYKGDRRNQCVKAFSSEQLIAQAMNLLNKRDT